MISDEDIERIMNMTVGEFLDCIYNAEERRRAKLDEEEAK